MKLHPLGRPAAAIVVLLCAAAVPADVFHLNDGRRIRVDRWRDTGTEYVFERSGGTVAIPKSLVVRVETTAAPAAGPPPPASTMTAAPPARRPGPVSGRTQDLSPESEQRLREAFEAAERARAENRFEAAVRAYEAVLRIDPGHLDAGIYRTACFLWLQRFGEALDAAHETMVYHPADPALLFLVGEIYYFQDRLPLALDSWQRSLELRDHPSIRARIEKVRRELAAEQSYQAIGGRHFRLRYDGAEAPADLARQILDHLEDRIGELSLRLDHFPAAPVSVILYPDQEFHQTTGAGHTVQGLFDGKIRVPVGGVTRLTDPLRRVLEHELAHALIDSKSGGNCPGWLHEGLAQHLSGDSGLPFRQELARQYLQLAGSEQWHPSLSYAAALSCVEYLASRHGFTAWVSILDRLGAGMGFADALWGTVRMRPEELYAGWGEDLQEGGSPRR